MTAAEKNPGGLKGGFRKVYNGVFGFKKSYNFPLWVIFGGALIGFSLARLMYLDFDGHFKDGALPGEYFYFSQTPYRAALLIHLGCILPAGLLVPFQFVPKIRQKYILYHRISGYLILLLLFISTGGALVLGRRSFGGEVTVIVGVYILSGFTIFAAIMAYINIKRLQIDQHRNWMLRTMFYMTAIISLRFIMVAAASAVTAVGSFAAVMRCEQIESIVDNSTEFRQMYPTCQTFGPKFNVAVPASFGKPESDAVTTASAFHINFGMAMWLAFVIHAIGVEFYIRLTPEESRRLRQVSYERQLARGFKHPGSAGLTSDRVGDNGGWWQPSETAVGDKLNRSSDTPDAVNELGEDRVHSSRQDVEGNRH